MKILNVLWDGVHLGDPCGLRRNWNSNHYRVSCMSHRQLKQACVGPDLAVNRGLGLKGQEVQDTKERRKQ